MVDRPGCPRDEKSKTVMNRPFDKKYRFGVIDIAAILFIAAFVVWFIVKMKTSLDYNWDFLRIPEYLVRKDTVKGGFKPNLLLLGFITTLKLSFWSTILAFFIGTAFGVMRVKGSPLQKFIAFCYVETIRNIPSLVLVFIFYFFVSSQFLDLLGIDLILRKSPNGIQNFISFFFTGKEHINAFISAVLTLAIYEGAYVTEIIKGGLSGIPRGQWDAGKSIGMTEFQTFTVVVLPQALRNVLSPLAGQFISTIKDSAIMSVISIQELTFQGMEIMSSTLLTFEVWITVTLLYFILTFTLSRLTARLERYFNEKY